jgi:uncharacterized lipoprotein
MHKKRILFSLLVLTLSGCAEKWVKPGATEQQFEAMKAACNSKAMAAFPPMLRQVPLSNGYMTPTTTDCTRNAYSVSCTTTEGQYVPPAMRVIDDNVEARNQNIRSCYYENGWHPEE